MVQAPDSGGPWQPIAVLKPTGAAMFRVAIFERTCNIHQTTGVVEVNPAVT